MNQIHAWRLKSYGISLSTWIAAALLSPGFATAQCPSVAASLKAENSLQRQPQFFDQPNFTVAGVTDTSNLGGHGSDTIWRTKESLARDTVSLDKTGQPGTANDGSEKALREAARDPANFEANHRLGKMLLDQDKAREAVPYLQQAAHVNPTDYQNSYELALVWTETGDYEGARKQAAKLLKNGDKSELHHLLGDIDEKSGNPLDAVHEYQRAAEMEPSESNLFDWGGELLLHHAPEPASEVFSRGSRLYPHSTRVFIGLGIAWYSRGSYEQAVNCLCKAADLNPNEVSPYLFLGRLLSVENLPSPGIGERMARFAKLHPENAMAQYYYAVSLWKQTRGSDSNSKEVEALLLKAVALDPKLGPAFLQLGILHSEQNRLADAIAAYQKAIHADPELEAAHYRLAQAYRQSGETSKAKKELQIYEQLSKQSAGAAERERHDLQQFVYTLREQNPKPQ